MSCAAGVVYQNSKFVSQANCSQLQSAASANQFMDEGHKPLYFKDFGITWDYFSITFQKKKGEWMIPHFCSHHESDDD